MATFQAKIELNFYFYLFNLYLNDNIFCLVLVNNNNTGRNASKQLCSNLKTRQQFSKIFQNSFTVTSQFDRLLHVNVNTTKSKYCNTCKMPYIVTAYQHGELFSANQLNLNLSGNAEEVDPEPCAHRPSG